MMQRNRWVVTEGHEDQEWECIAQDELEHASNPHEDTTIEDDIGTFDRKSVPFS